MFTEEISAVVFRDKTAAANILARVGKPRIMVAVARVAQLDRASVSEAEGYGFNSRRAHHFTLPYEMAVRRHVFRVAVSLRSE